VERRRQTAVCIVEWPLWSIPERARAQLADGTVRQVALPWAEGARVWVARSGKRLLACTPIGRATPEEIAAWCRARFVELVEQAKHPRPAPQHNPVEDFFKP
jgi:hypothetical protein